MGQGPSSPPGGGINDSMRRGTGIGGGGGGDYGDGSSMESSPMSTSSSRLPIVSQSPGTPGASGRNRPMFIPGKGNRSHLSHPSVIESPKPGGSMHLMSSPVTPSSSLSHSSNSVPVMFTWNLHGSKVSVTGSFVNWSTEIPMTKGPNGEWFVSHHLEPGVHQYKFVVDGEWCHHPNQPTTADAMGVLNNYVDVKEVDLKTLFRAPGTPPGEYNQSIPAIPDLKSKTQPPTIPPHLLRALLNTAPDPDDPSLLPLPHHVMVNHLYVFPQSAQRNCTIVGATHVFKGKYVTSVYYSPSSSRRSDQ